MLKQILYSAVFLSICTLQTDVFGISPDHHTKTTNYGFFDFFSSKPSTQELEQEIGEMKEKIQTLEVQQRELLSALNSAKADFVSNREEQKRRIDDSDELEHILVKYGNNSDGMSALHYAIKIGDVNAVNLLIANGANINAKNENFTALTRAANCNQYEIAKLLLDLGADVNITASENQYYSINYAAEFGSGNLVTLLIENGAILNKICPLHNDQNAKTPLHSACKAGNYEAVIALVKGGAKVDGNVSPNISVNHWNDGTPLDHAACSLTYKDNPQNLELVKFLVDHGAERRFKTYNGEGNHNYLSCSVISGYLKSVGK